MNTGADGDADKPFDPFEKFRRGQLTEVYLLTDQPDFDVAKGRMWVGADDSFERRVGSARVANSIGL